LHQIGNLHVIPTREPENREVGFFEKGSKLMAQSIFTRNQVSLIDSFDVCAKHTVLYRSVEKAESAQNSTSCLQLWTHQKSNAIHSPHQVMEKS
jgi:hypothetical protein